MSLTASYGALGNEENSDPELAWRIRHGLEKPAKRNNVTMKLCIVGGEVGVSLSSAAERVIFKMAMDNLAPFRLFVAQIVVLFYTLALSIPFAVRLVRHWDVETFIGESQIILIFCCCHGSYTRRACLSRRVKQVDCWGSADLLYSSIGVTIVRPGKKKSSVVIMMRFCRDTPIPSGVVFVVRSFFFLHSNGESTVRFPLPRTEILLLGFLEAIQLLLMVLPAPFVPPPHTILLLQSSLPIGVGISLTTYALKMIWISILCPCRRVSYIHERTPLSSPIVYLPFAQKKYGEVIMA